MGKKIFLITLIQAFFLVHAFAQDPVEVFVTDFNQHQLRITMEQNASALLTEINLAYTESRDLNLDDLSTVEDLDRAISNMWENTRFYIPESSIFENAAKLPSGYYEMRNIEAFFIDPNGEEIYEEMVLQFTPSGMISELRIGLAAYRYQSLMQEGADVEDRTYRKEILSFIETFRTSYNKKDINYLENVFSDQALIIVGRVVESTGQRSAYADQVEEQVEFLQFNKEDYIERLRHLFSVNEWIEVGFEDVDIVRHPKFDDIYGVELTQYYNSSIYSDVGYLFLLIDFQEPEKPMIHVRTWQPKRSDSESTRFQIGDLEIL